MVLMRQLLIDAQAKFRKMMSDNKALALKIDQDLQSAHHQVSVLRAELADTNQRINDIYCTTAASKAWPVNIVMAGNVITTCMPPTTTTNTAVSSTADGSWNKSAPDAVDPTTKKRDKVGSLLLSNKESSKEEKTRPIEDQPLRSSTNKSSVQQRPALLCKPDKLLQSEGSTSELKGNKGVVSKRSVLDKKDEAQQKRFLKDDSSIINGEDDRFDMSKGQPQKRTSALRYSPNNTSAQNSDQKLQTQDKNASDLKESSAPRRSLRVRQNSSPLNRSGRVFQSGIAEKDTKRSESFEFLSKDMKSVQQQEPKQTQQKGPCCVGSQTPTQHGDAVKSKDSSKQSSTSALTETDSKAVQQSGSQTDDKNVGVKCETHASHGDNPVPSHDSGNKTPNSWITPQTESSKLCERNIPEAVSDPLHREPVSKATANRSLDDHQTQDNVDRSDKKPYYQPWCSDTGDSLSDILTSDECSKDQSGTPEISCVTNALPRQKVKENEYESRNEPRVKNCMDYTSLRNASKDESGIQRPLDSEFEALKIKCSALQRDLEEVMESRDEKAKDNAQLSSQLERTEKELKHAKEALSALKQDRKRLKAEKFDLLTQMKQLYSTLEDKEDELREFIRNYEQKMKESDENLKQMSRERDELEKEKWSILQRAREEAERCVVLCTQLSLKDSHIRELQEELNTMREKQLSTDTEIRQSNGYGSPGSVSYRTVNGIDSRGTPTPTPGSDPTTSPSYSGGTPTIAIQFPSSKDSISGRCRVEDCTRPALLSRSAEDIFSSIGSTTSNSRKTKGQNIKVGTKEKSKGGTWGSISRVFSRSKQRRKALDPDLFQESRTSWSPKGSVCSSPLSEESYAQKLRLLEESHGAPMQHWRAATVLAWLEITMDMPQYGTLCAENIKSGKVLLELSDSELEEGLGISNAMHRRKLRLAIEEHREPSLCRYPKICLMTHSWVVEEWLPSIALTCYLPSFSEHLVDGRVLDTLTKKDLEKYFGISRKFHQLSIMHGIQLLRMLNFDRQTLNQRRMNCESMDVDPLVWTNQRFIKWANSIDLGEYADNLRNSGVHGALAVLEPTFTAETMATALGIPASKNIIRRHLTTEWQNLIQPARLSLESESVVAKKSKGEKRLVSGSSSTSLASQGKNSSLVQSYARRTLDRYDRKRTSWRFSTWRSSQESLKSTSSKKAPLPPPQIERPRLLPLSPKLNTTRHRRTFSSHSDVETLTVTPV